MAETSKIAELKAYLMKYYENPKEEKILYVFKKLDRAAITLDILQATGIGKTINSFRKHEGGVGKKARELVAKWKQLVNVTQTPTPAEAPAENANGGATHTPGLQCETVSETTYGSHSGRLTHRLDDIMKAPYMDGTATVKQEPSDEKSSKIKSEKHSKSSTGRDEKHHSSEKSHRGHSSQGDKHHRDKSGSKDRERKRERTGDNDEDRARKKPKLDSDQHESIPDLEQVKVKKERQDNGDSKVKIKMEKTEDIQPDIVVKQEKDSSHSKTSKVPTGEKVKHSETSSSRSQKHSKKHHDHRSSDRHGQEKHRSSEKEKSKKNEAHKSLSDSLDKYSSARVKTEPTEEANIIPQSDLDKVKTEPVEKMKVKTEPSDSSKKHKSDGSHQTKEKDSRSSDHRSSSKQSKSGSSHDDKSSSKSKDRSSSKSGSGGSSKDKHKAKTKSGHSSSKNSSSQSKNVATKKKAVEEFDMFSMPNGNDDLNSDENDGVKVKSEPKGNPKEKKKRDFTVHASTSKAVGFLAEPKPSLLMPPKPENSEVSEDDIIGSLPEPSPNYKPLPYLDLDTLNRNAERRAADTEIAYKKNCRTQVYSGRRNKFLTAVPSLYDSCIQVLKDNIDALDFVGGVPFDIMKPVLEICSPTQLYNIEDANPQFIGETDELWKHHCTKDFRKEKPEQFESWREMYIRCHDARDAKLKTLTASISASIAKAKEPVRTTKLAYIDGAAKPPRDVRRRQRMHGTAGPTKQDPLHRLTSHGATSSKMPRVSPLMRSDPNVSSSLKRNRDDRSSKVFAPMMKKTLKFMRHLKRK